jgi:hypothetical protein
VLVSVTGVPIVEGTVTVWETTVRVVEDAVDACVVVYVCVIPLEPTTM